MLPGVSRLYESCFTRFKTNNEDVVIECEMEVRFGEGKDHLQKAGSCSHKQATVQDLVIRLRLQYFIFHVRSCYGQVAYLR